jgi:hypothetical protein
MSTRIQTFAIFLLLATLLGCGDESLLEGVANDSSPEAKRIAAQQALDKSDCQPAIDLYSEVQASDPDGVASRINLSAAHLCAAGFSVRGFLDVAADFVTKQSSGSTEQQTAAKDSVLKDLITNSSTLIPGGDEWKINVCKSKALLDDIATNDTGSITLKSWPCSSRTGNATSTVSYRSNPDAGYLLSIIEVADATLTLSNALRAINGVIQCSQTATTTQTVDRSKCTFTTSDLITTAQSLLAARQSIVASTGDKGQLYRPIDNILFSADTSGNGQLDDAEVLNYLVSQKLITSNTVGVPANCTSTGTPPKYTCS